MSGRVEEADAGDDRRGGTPLRRPVGSQRSVTDHWPGLVIPAARACRLPGPGHVGVDLVVLHHRAEQSYSLRLAGVVRAEIADVLERVRIEVARHVHPAARIAVLEPGPPDIGSSCRRSRTEFRPPAAGSRRSSPEAPKPMSERRESRRRRQPVLKRWRAGCGHRGPSPRCRAPRCRRHRFAGDPVHHSRISAVLIGGAGGQPASRQAQMASSATAQLCLVLLVQHPREIRSARIEPASASARG